MKTLIIILLCLFYSELYSQILDYKIVSNIGVSVKFPGEPIYTNRPSQNTQSYNYSTENSTFVFQINQLISVVSESEFIENRAIVVNNFVNNLNGQLINSEVKRYGNRRCVDFAFIYNIPRRRIHKSRAFVHRDRLIIISYSADEFDNNVFNRFVNTVKFP